MTPRNPSHWTGALASALLQVDGEARASGRSREKVRQRIGHRLTVLARPRPRMSREVAAFFALGAALGAVP